VQYAAASTPFYVWNTLQSNVGTALDWLVMCGKNAGTSPNNIMADGAPVGTATGGLGGDVLTINGGGSSGTALNSNFAFSQLMVWNQALSDADMLTASQLLTSYLLTGSYFSYASTWPYSIPKPMAWYRAENYLPKWKSLPDTLGNGAWDAVTSGVTYGAGSGNAASASVAWISGGTGATVLWPAGSVPKVFTMCSLTRYTGGSNPHRILTVKSGYTKDFYQGHYGSKRGAAHYGGIWQTDSTATRGLSLTDCEL
jgi:hypothetical protein